MNPFGSPVAGGGFNPYAAGQKMYGNGRPMPTSGPVDKLGYAQRDLMLQAQRNAMLSRLRAGQQGNYMSSQWLGGPSYANG